MIESDLVNELFQSTIQNRNKLALAVNNNSLTYSQLWQSICSISYKLDKQGIVAGDRILFSLDNTLDFIILHFAVLKLGAISIPLDTMISETNLNSIIKDVNPALIIALSLIHI